MRNKIRLGILLILVLVLTLGLLLCWLFIDRRNAEGMPPLSTSSTSASENYTEIDIPKETDTLDVTETHPVDTEPEDSESDEAEPTVTEVPATEPPATGSPVTNPPATDPSEDDGVSGEFDTPIG